MVQTQVPVKCSYWHVASVEAPVVDRISKHVYRGWMPCIEWCEAAFGEMSHSNYRWRFVGEGVFEFREESDRTAFLLKWS